MSVHHFVPTAWHSVLDTLPAAIEIECGDTIVTETVDANGLFLGDYQRSLKAARVDGWTMCLTRRL